MRRQRLSALAVIFCSVLLLPTGSVDAQTPHGGGTAVFRYHFVAGQHLTYNVTFAESLASGGAGAGDSSGSGLGALVSGGLAISGAARVDEEVLSIAPSGVAAVRATTHDLTMTTTIAGQTSQNRIPDTTVVEQIASDGRTSGSVSSNGFGAMLNTFGSLPPGPVAPGAQWRSTTSGTLPPTGGAGATLPSLRVVTTNTFTGYTQAHGQIAAVITSSAPFTYATHASQAGVTLGVRLSGQATGRTLFGLEMGQLVASTVHEDLAISVSSPTATGGQHSLTLRLVVNLGETLLS